MGSNNQEEKIYLHDDQKKPGQIKFVTNQVKDLHSTFSRIKN